MTPRNPALTYPGVPDELRLQIGTWAAMDYDRLMFVDGLPWRRVKGGFGGDPHWYPREDWVLDLPGTTISVKRNLHPPTLPKGDLRPTAGRKSLWEPDFLGKGGYERIVDAMRAKAADKLPFLEERMQKAAKELAEYAVAKAMIEAAV